MEASLSCDSRGCYAAVLSHGGNDCVPDSNDEDVTVREKAIDLWGESWYTEVEQVVRMRRELLDCEPLLCCMLNVGESPTIDDTAIFQDFLMNVEDGDYVMTLSLLPFVFEFHSKYL